MKAYSNHFSLLYKNETKFYKLIRNEKYYFITDDMINSIFGIFLQNNENYFKQLYNLLNKN